ncbi:hypothetical protein MTR67_002679 [Solanum verrucosum]|uniref:Uncharacterized protein n=1 Tax=Solanum verrucosum TaxID=315347 RepID=A0AAF0T907_SOLVR|nr:hypothetical protein MTR67_002679 [Solanum verrucosum]
MFRACVIDIKGSCDDHLPLIMFAYNNSYHSSIQMTPYEALYGRRCRSPVGLFEVGEEALIGPDLVYDAMEKVQPIREDLRQPRVVRSPMQILTYEEVPIEILHRQVRRLRKKEVASVKGLWSSQSIKGATWETEATMKAKYPHLLPFDSIPA